MPDRLFMVQRFLKSSVVLLREQVFRSSNPVTVRLRVTKVSPTYVTAHLKMY
ncbi:hypothetical protein O3G_MSEX003120 [Manduca sexta]|uniref:Uncharacterized protein n=1 Tax=Manduca sexta TaxID=7130 RepID=A0A921YQR8_MANSE|nr:hypothetical protein O3G_MSEX003120 [Manduca sexta]